MVTMQDIAEAAKVSRGTVSYVLNGKYKQAKICKATNEKILAVAEKLGYRRNAIAQSVKTGKTNVIGIIGGLYSSYCMEIIEGINDIASKKNYIIKLFPTKTTDEVKNAARKSAEQRLAGVICRSLTEEDLEILQEELEPNNIPIVLIDSSFSHEWCSRVISDDFAGAKVATEHLLELGHRNIGFVTKKLSRGFSKVRYDGYMKAMAEWGIEVGKNDICVINSRDKILNTSRKIIKDFLERKKPTAVFCAADPLAMQVMSTAYSLDIKIPQDLLVTGFGGLNYTAFSSPPLTTVQQPFMKMGRKASEILLSEIKEKSSKKKIKLPVELIIRESTRKHEKKEKEK